MKKISMILAAVMIGTLFTACTGNKTAEDSNTGSLQNVTDASQTSDYPKALSGAEDKSKGDTANTGKEENTIMQLKIEETNVSVEWESNESVEALKALCEDQPLKIQMSMYGGFEQVGSIGQSLPRNDVQTTTQAGDIVLYSGNQIVVFYGSNSWAYTRLGRITGQTADDMKRLLGNGDVTITVSGGSAQ